MGRKCWDSIGKLGMEGFWSRNLLFGDLSLLLRLCLFESFLTVFCCCFCKAGDKSERLLLTGSHCHVSIRYRRFQGRNLGSFTGIQGNFSAKFLDVPARHAHRAGFPDCSSSCCSLRHGLSPPCLQRPPGMGLDGGAAPQPGFGVSSNHPLGEVTARDEQGPPG